MISRAKNVDEYIKRERPKVQILLRSLRKIIKNTAPKAEEMISYGMPAYKYHGMLLYFASHTNHVGLYIMPSGTEAFRKELAKYKTHKATAQFPLDKPLPLALIKKIVKFRVKENEAKVKSNPHR